MALSTRGRLRCGSRPTAMQHPLVTPLRHPCSPSLGMAATGTMNIVPAFSFPTVQVPCRFGGTGRPPPHSDRWIARSEPLSLATRWPFDEAQDGLARMPLRTYLQNRGGSARSALVAAARERQAPLLPLSSSLRDPRGQGRVLLHPPDKARMGQVDLPAGRYQFVG